MKILLVDDHEMVRLGLKSYFDLQDDVEVVGEASNGSQGIDLALELRPDVIVMDIVMPEMNGIDATLAILKEWPEAKILIVTSYLDNEKIMPVLDAGAKGYMLKTSSADELLHAVSKVAAGELAIEQEVSKKVEYHRNHMELHEELTARERDVLNSSPRATKISASQMTSLSLSRRSRPTCPIFLPNLKSAIVPRRLSMPFSTIWWGKRSFR